MAALQIIFAPAANQDIQALVTVHFVVVISAQQDVVAEAAI